LNTWIIDYQSDETLNEIKKIGHILFEPEFPQMNFIIMKSYLSKETILQIDGVSDCREPITGKFNDVYENMISTK
jgi:hypothetical protein